MKYVVLFGVLLVVYLLWKAQRSAERAERAAERAATPKPPASITQQEMVRCPVCSVHLPRPDASEGGSGRLYCSPEHRVRGGN
jgi:uncharacterized protein